MDGSGMPLVLAALQSWAQRTTCSTSKPRNSELFQMVHQINAHQSLKAVYWFSSSNAYHQMKAMLQHYLKKVVKILEIIFPKR